MVKNVGFWRDCMGLSLSSELAVSPWAGDFALVSSVP